MKKLTLRQFVFLALCCDLGLFSKKLIAPAANVITGALHIPGGVSTAFSLMFLTVGAAVVGRFGAATVMAAVQSALALAFGMVGSMGALAPIGYLVPGLLIDCALWLTGRTRLSLTDRMVLANTVAAVAACLTANAIVFRLWGPILLLYICVSCTCGALFGLLGGKLAPAVTRAVAPTRKGGAAA